MVTAEASYCIEKLCKSLSKVLKSLVLPLKRPLKAYIAIITPQKIRGCRQRKSTREGFVELLRVFEGYLGESFPCRNPLKTFNKTNEKQTKTKENKQKLYFMYLLIVFSVYTPEII